VAQLRCTLEPGTPGRIRGRLPDTKGRSAGGDGVDVVAVTGYEPGDRVDAWYDALLATVSAAADDLGGAVRAAGRALSELPDAGVPHDGRQVCAVLDRLASDQGKPGR
jgi:pyruvate carboxylase